MKILPGSIEVTIDLVVTVTNPLSVAVKIQNVVTGFMSVQWERHETVSNVEVP